MKIGDHVTIVSRSSEGGLAFAVVGRHHPGMIGSGPRITWVTLAEIETLAEGVWWCRGWEGPQVDALRAAEAIR